MMIDYPGKIRDPGGIRRQLVDVIDVAPTLLEIAGTSFAPAIDGVTQLPVAGKSFLPELLSANASAARSVQFFEMRGNRAILAGDWRAVAMHQYGTTFEKDRWQLFNVARDPSESTDLSQQNPHKLKELQQLWQTEAQKYGALPLMDAPIEKGFDDAFLD